MHSRRAMVSSKGRGRAGAARLRCTTPARAAAAIVPAPTRQHCAPPPHPHPHPTHPPYTGTAYSGECIGRAAPACGVPAPPVNTHLPYPGQRLRAHARPSKLQQLLAECVCGCCVPDPSLTRATPHATHCADDGEKNKTGFNSCQFGKLSDRWERVRPAPHVPAVARAPAPDC